MGFDYQSGGIFYDKYYPALRPVNQAIKKLKTADFSAFYLYEPGNATRYEVLFTTYNDGYGPKTVMTLINFRKSMIITNEMSPTSLGYMQEKLDLGEGDCYALIPLINQYLEELGR